MFDVRDIGINQSICVRGGAAIAHLAQEIQLILERIAQGEGSLLRFKLVSPLSPGGSAEAQILAFEDGGYSVQRSGTVFDEEPGAGFWQGDAGDEGWCTARDETDGEYSVIFMTPLDSDGNINQAFLELLNQIFGTQAFLDLLLANATFLAFHEQLFDTVLANRNFIVKPDQDIAKGATDGCTIYVNETTTGVSLDFKALGAAVLSGKWCVGWIEPSSGNRYVAPWECS